ncbi:alpha-amylase, partial [Myxococcota bacterium]
HLGQVLFTGDDFVILDFEGEPARTMGERRLKRSALTDVAGMLRSFSYAACTALTHRSIRIEDVGPLWPWTQFWQEWVTTEFLKSYVAAARGGSFLPEVEEMELLLDALVLAKAVYELEYEIHNRPEWVQVPLTGLAEILRQSGRAT